MAEASNYTHGASVLKSASLLHHQLSELDAAADIYSAAVRSGVANVDMLVDYAQVASFPVLHASTKPTYNPQWSDDQVRMAKPRPDR